MTQLVSSLKGWAWHWSLPSTPRAKWIIRPFSAWWNTKSREDVFLVALGTTGETPTLSSEERRRVVDFVLEVNAAFQWWLERATIPQRCERIAAWDVGVAAFLVATPAYNKHPRGLVKHYEAVANAAERPSFYTTCQAERHATRWHRPP